MRQLQALLGALQSGSNNAVPVRARDTQPVRAFGGEPVVSVLVAKPVGR